MGAIETKVLAALSGSGFGAALGSFLVWLLGVVVWGQSASADNVSKAVAAVPEPAGALLAILVAALGAGVAGYQAPHTHRPDLPSAGPQPAAVSDVSVPDNAPAAPDDTVITPPPPPA